VIRYFDASALAKRYVFEPESPQVSQLLKGGPPAISRLTEVEVASALARRTRENILTPRERDRALAALEQDMSTFYVVELLPEVIALAIDLLTRYRLRGPDTIQLASCLFLKKHLLQEVEFIAFDRQLVDVAKRKGLQVWKPS
jgi:predicted nucleic acid-binding protein